jgi:hypothetical protein
MKQDQKNRRYVDSVGQDEYAEELRKVNRLIEENKLDQAMKRLDDLIYKANGRCV